MSVRIRGGSGVTWLYLLALAPPNDDAAMSLYITLAHKSFIPGV